MMMVGEPKIQPHHEVGAWRSLVAYLNGVQRVGGSNPLAPTNDNIAYGHCPGKARAFFFNLATCRCFSVLIAAFKLHDDRIEVVFPPASYELR
jgi:hypothetical protein